MAWHRAQYPAQRDASADGVKAQSTASEPAYLGQWNAKVRWRQRVSLRGSSRVPPPCCPLMSPICQISVPVTLQICWMAASAVSAPPPTHQAKWRECHPPPPATPLSLPSRICPQSENRRARDTIKDWCQEASLQGRSFLLRPSTLPSPFGLSGMFVSERLFSWLHLGDLDMFELRMNGCHRYVSVCMR